MSQQHVLIVGGRIENIRKAKEQGLGVVHLQQPDQFTTEHASLVDAALLVDYTDWSVTGPLVAAAHRVYGFTSVATTTEAGVEPAGRISDLLGLGGVSHEVTRLLRDKLSMRRHLAAAAPSISVAAEEVGDRGSLEAFGARHGYPFIVKPVDGIGSLGLQLVESADRLDEVWETIARLRHSDHQFARFFPLERFLMEEYISGPELSVEAFTFGGRHVVAAVTEKLTYDNFVELGHVVPARITPADEAAVVACVTEFLDAVGVASGPSHTEVRLSERGPLVIESHNRPGGDRIRDLVEEAYGFDIERYTVAWPGGGLPALEERPAPLRAAATRFLGAEPGTVTAVEGLEAARSLAGVLDVDLAVERGSTVRPLRSSWDRPGQVIAVAPDADAAVALCEKACATVRISTAPDPAE
ncbi:ATP-grasp domain-containing protein [Streptomyces sp. SCUT-3]|uniref:ATP-grasp domain-containing protein n=1 Tax=Streptomyces TaxID=1883 RepID=UPI0015FB8A3E|nr:MULTISPECIES: ATP-grasp domain-containing protein [unclassified Streptomyces]MCZ2526886.1 ATP-grasp domain-containing protein [Streptomyces sp. HB2AG]QMV23176.1 ATP-grasp domain-containing protein [Streptomyces sp. SCUT-3]